MTGLSITGCGSSFAITAGGQTVADHYTSHCNAVAALRGVEARLRPVLIRSCLCCQTHFKSTGPGNRLCRNCRKGA